MKAYFQKNILLVYLFLCALFAASFVHAQAKKVNSNPAAAANSKTQKGRDPQNSNGIHVMPVDPNFPAEELERDGYNTHSYDRKLNPAEPSQSPDPDVRDQHLLQAGLGPVVKGWDHFERDMLYLRASNYSFTQLRLKYPKVSPQALQKLQTLINAENKQ